MIPSGNSYTVLRLLLFSAVDVGNKPKTMDLLSTQQPSLSSIPILPIPHPSQLPSLLSSLQQQAPSPTPVPPPAPDPTPIPAGTHPHHHPHNYNHPGDINPNTYIPSRDTLLPLCIAPSTNQRHFTPLSPYSISVLSGPIFVNFPGLRDLLELVETKEGKEQIRNAMAQASGDDRELGELGRVEAERFLAFWEHEFAV
ncbi:hypothetical protein B0T09DRAFT_403673 [Sordaria sp. MPI-SDFR-AT-0083]|nr:hypothetical protein B0T09DRAFT_403673 [Sordaria sp. MPI-SDFR-AT-0083]